MIFKCEICKKYIVVTDNEKALVQWIPTINNVLCNPKIIHEKCKSTINNEHHVNLLDYLNKKGLHKLCDNVILKNNTTYDIYDTVKLIKKIHG